MKVLVVGSTGVVGREVCRRLTTKGHQVRGLVRVSSDPDVVAGLTGAGVESAVGDLTSRSSLDAACAGVDVVVSTATAIGSQVPTDSLAAVDMEGQMALIDAARDAGVGRVIYVSVLGDLAESAFATAKSKVELHLLGSGLHATIVRPSVFMDTWLSPHVGFDWAGGAVTIYGDGSNAQAWIHSGDVAEIVAATVDAPATADSEIAALGPQSMTPMEVVAIFEQVTGRSFEVSHVPAEYLEAQRAGAEHPTEQSFAALMLRYAAGDPPGAHPTPGLPLAHTTVEEYARRLISSQS